MSTQFQSAPVIRTRPLALEDLPRILAIERQAYSYPWSEAVFRDCLRPDYRLMGLELDGDLVAYGVLAFMVDEAHLLNLCVRPSLRRRGYAGQLLQRLLTVAADNAMVQMILEVRRSNDAAAGLYRRAGFRVIGERPGYYPMVGGRESALVMARPLLSGPASGQGICT